MKYMCPVCGYPNLEAQPTNHEICSSCGTQFGYDDYLRSHSELRQEWLDNDAKWFLVGYEPYGWNAYSQLENAGLLKISGKPRTQSTVVNSNVNQDKFKMVREFNVRTQNRLIYIDNIRGNVGSSART